MITKAALLLFRGQGDGAELMFVRPRGKPYLVFPGGKQEPGETIQRALVRELQEELQADVADVQALGVVTGNTPDGRPMTMHLYGGGLVGEPHPAAEIEAVVWLNRAGVRANQASMTPMTLDHVLPFLQAKNMW